MDDNAIKNKIIDCIASESSTYRICEKVYDLLEKQCTPIVLEFFFKETDAYMSSERGQKDEEEQIIKEKAGRYDKVWGEILITLMKERLDNEKFYAKLWDSISNTPLFDSREARICILYLTCQNMCIPYYKLYSDMKIEEEQYWGYIEELHDNIVKARSLVFQPCTRYTERAAALMALLKQQEGREKEAVLFAQMIKLFELRGKLKK